MIQVASAQILTSKRVILRLDLDVPIQNGEILDDYRLQAALPTLQLCLINAESTTIIGHIGRPKGVVVESLSVEPIFNYFENIFGPESFESGALEILENLRFEPGEDSGDLNFAKDLTSYGDFFVNEAFAAHHPAASTTVLPKLLPHAIGLRFTQEIQVLSEVRASSKRPQVAIIGGAKIEDKYPALTALSKFCDYVLVGGLLPTQIRQQNLPIFQNVILGEIAPSGLDISEATVDHFSQILKTAKRVIWAGPMGKYEDPQANQGSLALAKTILENNSESIIGGGDTETALAQYLKYFSFVSVGGGAMLKFLSEGTLPTLEALQ